MWTEQVRSMIGTGILETLYMTVVSTVFGYLFGLPMGILLCITDKEGLKPNKVVYKILDVIANIVRSIPFLILLILLIPFTRLLLGKSYGSTATIVPLTAAAIPFIARMVESSLKEVDYGVIEAAKAMGASNSRIIFRVLLVEARTSRSQAQRLQSERSLDIPQWQVQSAVADLEISQSVTDITGIRQTSCLLRWRY